MSRHQERTFETDLCAYALELGYDWTKVWHALSQLHPRHSISPTQCRMAYAALTASAPSCEGALDLASLLAEDGAALSSAGEADGLDLASLLEEAPLPAVGAPEPSPFDFDPDAALLEANAALKQRMKPLLGVARE